MLTEEPQLIASAAQFQEIGEAWEGIGEWFRSASEAENPAHRLPEITAPMLGIADREQQAWVGLRQLAAGRR